MINITSWFALADKKNEEDKRTVQTNNLAKSQKRFGMNKVYTFESGCTVIEPHYSFWLNKQKP